MDKEIDALVAKEKVLIIVDRAGIQIKLYDRWSNDISLYEQLL